MRYEVECEHGEIWEVKWDWREEKAVVSQSGNFVLVGLKEVEEMVKKLADLAEAMKSVKEEGLR